MKSMQMEKEQQAAAAASIVHSGGFAHALQDEFGPIAPPNAIVGPAGTPFSPQRSFSASHAHLAAAASFLPQQQSSPPPPPAMAHMMSGYGLTSPPPQQQPPQGLKGASGVAAPAPSNELDLNDPATLEIYSRILLFKDDPMRDELAFSRTLTPKQRRVVHLIAQKLGVYHYSLGEGEERYAVVTRVDPDRVSVPYF